MRHSVALLTSISMLSISDIGNFELEVTTFQMIVPYSWESWHRKKLTLDGIQLITLFPDSLLLAVLWASEAPSSSCDSLVSGPCNSA